jgi:hypothetical protein
MRCRNEWMKQYTFFQDHSKYFLTIFFVDGGVDPIEGKPSDTARNEIKVTHRTEQFFA